MELQKILIALDASTSSATLMKIAAELAHKTNAELQALYIEDIEWFEASQQVFTQQISSYTGELLPFSEQHISVQSKALKRLLQSTFSNISRLMNIRYSYHTVRGVVDKELLEAASHVDLIVVSRAGHPMRHQYKLGRSTLELADKSPAPVLIWNSGSRWPDTVTGICTTADQSKQVIDWAVTIADKLGIRARLFWPENVDLRQVNFSLSLPVEMLERISVHSGELKLEELMAYKNSLLVICRQHMTQTNREFLESTANSVLLL